MTSDTGAAFAADERTPVEAPGASVTVVAGNSFLICTPEGDILPGGAQGYFAGDTRLVSALRLRVSGSTPRLLVDELDGQEVRSVSTVGDPTRPDLMVTRSTLLGDRLTVTVTLEGLTADPVDTVVELNVAADFADLFDVKRGERPRAGFVGAGPSNGALVLAYESQGFRRGLRVSCDRPCEVLRDGISVPLTVPGHGETTVRFELRPEAALDTPLAASGFGPVDPARWEASRPRLQAEPEELEDIWLRSCEDLGTLLLAEPGREDRPIVAAGSPWFMALFGRDSLITSWSALLLGPALCLGTLRALAERQGTRYVPGSAEEPGRILHELRAGEVVLRPDGWGAVYYGSVDATPLFVMTLTELWRWGGPSDELAALLPAAERAVAWILGDGDPDRDGLVEYGGTRPPGVAALANQAWKDSDDAVRHADGSIAEGPIAMVEVQGYCHAALLGLAELREAFGTGDPDPLRERAARLAEAIEERFWMDDEDCYAMALDGEKRPVRSVSTNPGHLLWTGTVRGERARRLAARLMAEDMFTGFGLRTLSATNPAYNPLSYHCGSVWPHDSAIVAAGMLRAGCVREGQAVARAVLDAARAFGGRPPELFGGFSSKRFSRPVPYPTSCSPQAWASASPLLLVRALLGLEPDVPHGRVVVDPHLPTGWEIDLRRIPVGTDRLDLHARGDTLVAAEAAGLAVVRPEGVDAARRG